jgi:hypothetical protein
MDYKTKKLFVDYRTHKISVDNRTLTMTKIFYGQMRRARMCDMEGPMVGPPNPS